VSALTLCIGVLGGALHALPGSTATLAWQHSVEKVQWEEQWQATPAGLKAGEARIRGSGAGMEPPPEARFHDGWYVYHPDLPPQKELIIPDSTFTAPATLCVADQCAPLAAWAGRPAGDTHPIRLGVCSGVR